MAPFIQKWRRFPFHAAAVVLVLGHFVLLLWFSEPAFSTPDANGYTKQAQLIANHGRTWFQEASPIQYVGLHWMAVEGDRIYSRYPPGLPLLMAMPIKFMGIAAGMRMNVVFTTLALIGLYVLAARWIGRGWALVAVASMVMNPMVNTCALTGDAHAATAFFLVWGIIFLSRWSQSISAWWALAAGLFLGFIPAIRYPEALFGIGIVFYIFCQVHTYPKARVTALVAVISACLPIVALMVHNQMAFGAVWRTAYSFTREQAGFSLAYFAENWLIYLSHLVGHGVGVVLIFGVVGLTLLCINRQTRIEGGLLVLLVLPVTLLYTAYFFMLEDHPYSTLRFLVPTFYIYALAGVWGLKMVAAQWKGGATALAAFLLLVHAGWGVPRAVVSMVTLKDANASLVSVEKTLNEYVTPNAIVIAPAHIQQHLDGLGTWRLMEPMAIEGMPMMLRDIIGQFSGETKKGSDIPSMATQAAGSREARLFMIVSQDIKRKTRMQPYVAAMTGMATEALLNELDRWRGRDREIYWLGDIEKMRARVPPQDRLAVIARIAPPPLLASTLNKRFPRQWEQLTHQLWKGLFARDAFITNPMGTTWLIHREEGLSLVKWVRSTDK